MKRNRTILTVLTLVLLSAGSFTLAKYTVSNTFVLQVKDEKYDSIPPPVIDPPEIKQTLDPWTVETGCFNKSAVDEGVFVFVDYTYKFDQLGEEVKATDVGTFVIQLWGGSGGNYWDEKNNLAGAGGYLIGLVQLKKGETIHVALGRGDSGIPGGASPWSFSKGAGGGTGDGDRGGNGIYRPGEDGYTNGNGGGGRSVVIINRDGKVDGDISMIAGGGGGVGNNYSLGTVKGGDGGSIKNLTAIDISSNRDAVSNWYYFPGESSPNGGEGGDIGTTHNKDAITLGGGGGDGVTVGEAGSSFTEYENTLGSSGGGGSSGINVSQVQPIVEGSLLMSKLKEIIPTGLNHPAVGTNYEKYGGVQIIQLLGVDYDELAAIPLK